MTAIPELLLNCLFELYLIVYTTINATKQLKNIFIICCHENMVADSLP